MRENMKPVLVIPFELFPQTDITNYGFVLKIGAVDQIQRALEIANEYRQCISILCEFNNVGVDSLLKMNIQSSVRMYINCSFNGDMLAVIKSLEVGKNSAFVEYLFPSNTPELLTLLKVLSSCGYKSGIQFDSASLIDEDTFVELATYSYYSPVRHEPIEPFGFMQQEIHDRSVKYVDLNKFYFNAPDTFAHVAMDGSVYLSCAEFPEMQRRLCSSIQEVSQINFEDISLEYKKLRFYNHFDNEDECSKCANFKLCSGLHKERFDNCQETMATIYEMLF